MGKRLLTRRTLIAESLKSSAAFFAALGLSPELAAAATEKHPFAAADYEAFRKGLRAFYPDECHGACKDPRQIASVKAIGDELDVYFAAHPTCDVLDLRRESYLAMRRHFVPFILPGSPFYFEAGVNGGWCVWKGAESVPGRHVNRLTQRFVRERNLFSPEDLAHKSALGKERCALTGMFVDDMHHLPPFKTVFTKGFGGVRCEVENALAKCPADDPHGRKWLETALVGLDTIHSIQLKFADEANRLLQQSNGLSAERANELRRIADAALRCPWEPPRNFYEGLNTLWFVREILGYVEGTLNFSLGRPDAWLIGFYRADLAAGRITEAEMRNLVAKFLVISDCHLDNGLTIDGYSDQEAEMPITLGGCDEDGNPVWNELTEAILDAHLGLGLIYPKLHCRISEKSPEAYLRKIGNMLMKDHAVFALFNDDRHIPNFLARGYALDRARDYVCCGCWDGNVDSDSNVDAAAYISVIRLLELTLNRDPKAERALRTKIDPIDGAESFEEVRDIIYRNFIRFLRGTMALYTRNGGRVAELAARPAYSACLKGCVAARRDALEGGSAFKPRNLTLAFLANVVDSLCAIRKVCFEDKTATLAEFLSAVRSNWQGPRGEELRQAAMAAPYWGDDSEASNGLMRFWINHVTDDTAGITNEKGGPYEIVCWIYREFMYWGLQTKATPDGRRDGDRLAQGFTPSEFKCKAGVTTVFNAIGSLDHSRLYASNANLSFEKSAMSDELFADVFRVACKKGMHLLQPNCTSVAELLDAQAHPELHQNLIVKVCGFSARFVALSKRWQDEVIERHRLK